MISSTNAEPPGRILALDVGGTSMKGLVLGPGNEIESTRRWPTPRESGPERVVDAVMRAVDELRAEASDATALGLVVPGLVDDVEGVAVYSENIGWTDVPFRRLAEERTGLPVGFGHDVRAGGLAERVMGAARGVDDVLFMPIGTGISGAMYVEGRSVANRYAGEIGHLNVGSAIPCACGDTGCLETVATGPSIASRYNEATGSSVSGSKPVVDRMLAGDGVAARVWLEAVDAIAYTLASYVTLLAPQRIVIGGGVSAAGEALLAPLRESLYRRLVWQQKPELVGATLGDSAASLGAGILARQALERFRSVSSTVATP